ncbi:acyltransferase family protein [Thermobifida halotolerans]|uniref:Acyltransferase family protein n=1 Tax=Thermobifida halotolerans TaxID=483545 RepID=A0AA97LVT2_9ACTN|nr:acyltransferase family protein [Thermobifida halotolerans]UOE19083.1 acyltransferase family protein [Thermobifida halotolerans]
MDKNSPSQQIRPPARPTPSRHSTPDPVRRATATDRPTAPPPNVSAASPAEAAAPPRPRLHYLDHLRAALTVLVVLHHASLAYSNIPAWYYIDPVDDPSSTLLDVFLVLNQAFFMGFFFLVSGFFTPGSHDRKGARGFLRGRLIRLGVPLLLYLLLVRPVVYLGIYLTDPDGTPYWLFYVKTWEPGPMWFVEVLLVFALAYALIRRFRLTRRTAPATAVRRAGPTPAPGPLAVAGFVTVLALTTYLWRTVVPMGTTWPIIGLPTPAFMPQYVLMFAAGVLAFRRGWLNAVPRWAGWGGAGAALLMAPVYVLLLGALRDTALPPGSWQSLVLAVAENVLATGAVLALLALFQRWLNRRSAVWTFLSEQAYAVYFLHPLVLIGLNHAFSLWEAPAVAKFAAVGTLALPLCWGAAYLLRSLPRADRVF